MKQPKLSDVVIDREGTLKIRKAMANRKKVKITINIDRDSLHAIRSLAFEHGASYQKLLNQLLREALKSRKETDSRLDRLELELERLNKKKTA